MERESKRLFERQGACPHRNLSIDPHGEIVLCKDCGHQVSAFWALQKVCGEWAAAAQKHQARAEKLEADKAANIHLVAAKRAQDAWRKKDVLPRCPHCSAGIAPTDGFGTSFINKRLDEAARLARAAAAGRESEA